MINKRRGNYNNPGAVLQNELDKKPLTMNLNIVACPICNDSRTSKHHTPACSREMQRRRREGKV